jgi:RES domain-containing protein
MTNEFSHDLLLALEELPSSAWSGTAWRIALRAQPPLRANVRGARWNPKDLSALYLSTTLECARAEFLHVLYLQPLRPSLDAVEYEVQVRLNRLLDLRGPDTLRALGIDVTDFDDTLKGMARFQHIGAAASFLGYDGLLVPSVRFPLGINLVVYPDVSSADGMVELEIVSQQPFASE